MVATTPAAGPQDVRIRLCITIKAITRGAPQALMRSQAPQQMSVNGNFVRRARCRGRGRGRRGRGRATAATSGSKFKDEFITFECATRSGHETPLTLQNPVHVPVPPPAQPPQTTAPSTPPSGFTPHPPTALPPPLAASKWPHRHPPPAAAPHARMLARAPGCTTGPGGHGVCGNPVI